MYTPEQNGTAKRIPRTCRELAELVETRSFALQTRLEENKALLTEIALMLGKNDTPPADTTSISLEQLMHDLVRTLLASGGGERFDPAIREAIRGYKRAEDEIRRLQRAGSANGEDPIAGFTYFLEQHRLRLEQLGVSITPVEKGTALDLSRHRIVDESHTEDSTLVGTVAESISPYFSWTNLQGGTGFEPAEVIAVTASKPEQEPTPRRRQNPQLRKGTPEQGGRCNTKTPPGAK